MKDIKEEATSIFFETLRSIQIDSIVRERVRLNGDQLFIDDRSIDLRRYSDLVLIGFGKASASVGAAIEAILCDRLVTGLLVTNRRPRVKTKSELIVAGHPLPNENSLKAGEKVIQLIESCSPDSLILFAISGGGSSLVELPLCSDVTLNDLRELNRVLINCGAAIREINVVRKHLSRAKGGRLGYLARHSRSVALFVSDVNPGDVRSIASNPLLPDDASYDEFLDILERYGLKEKLPASVKELINSGAVPKLPAEWQSEGKDSFSLMLLENTDALSAAAKAAAARGFRVEVDPRHTDGDYKGVADAIVERLVEMLQGQVREGICLVSGGEVSCSVTGRGFGGRNQEFVLYCAARLAARGFGERIAVLSCGTDGIDGNSSAAGAVADLGLMNAAKDTGLDASRFLAENSSTSFFSEAGGLVVTGPTGNNVRDLTILLIN